MAMWPPRTGMDRKAIATSQTWFPRKYLLEMSEKIKLCKGFGEFFVVVVVVVFIIF